MGISSNQARFLALTSRQVDLEHRIQQICQRRLRLSSELENVATSYNNKISNRKLFSMNTANSGITDITQGNLAKSGYKLIARQGNSPAANAITEDIRYQGGVLNVYAPIGAGSPTAVTPQDLGLPAGATESEMTSEALKQGLFSVGVNANEYTQTRTSIWSGTINNYEDIELKDWRTIPVIADELYKGDDVEAENKYDKTIAEINAQDKKLQLEQTSIEVEYKAITSEKESVKKVLDTNAQASFKYFS